MQTRLQEQLKDREMKLIEQGVRRSKRIANKNDIYNIDNPEANEINEEIIPNSFEKAKESKDWLY